MSKKNNILISIFILFFPFMIIVFTIVDFQSEPVVNYDNEKVSMKAPLCSEESIYYSDISEIKYINDLDYGEKIREYLIKITQQDGSIMPNMEIII